MVARRKQMLQLVVTTFGFRGTQSVSPVAHLPSVYLCLYKQWLEVLNWLFIRIIALMKSFLTPSRPCLHAFLYCISKEWSSLMHCDCLIDISAYKSSEECLCHRCLLKSDAKGLLLIKHMLSKMWLWQMFIRMNAHNFPNSNITKGTVTFFND